MTQEPDSKQQDNHILNIVDDHEEEVVSPTGQKERHKGVYLLPNLFTTAALFAGFFAIISGMKGNFEAAGLAIIVAQLLDGFDGRVARMTNTTSAFGVQYDSLSDMVSFGLAPALVIFSWGLEPLGKWGWAAAFLYAACAALRLARFNTQVEVVDNKFFVGLASPPAAAILATTVWLWHDVVPPIQVSILVALVTVCIGLLMVSSVSYTSFKGINFRGRVPFAAMLVALLIFTIITINPPTVLLAMACLYCISGPAMWAFRLSKAKKTTEIDTENATEEQPAAAPEGEVEKTEKNS